MERVEFDSRFLFDDEEVIWNANASEVFPSRDFPDQFCLISAEHDDVLMTKSHQEDFEGDIAYVDYKSAEDVIQVRLFND